MAYTLLIDLGNSLLKAALANQQGIIRKWSFLHESGTKKKLAAIASACASRPDHIVMATVVPQKTEKLLQIIARVFGVKALLAGKDIPIPLENRYKNPELLGVDRLLAAYAARNLRSETANIMVVDIGTAITFDCISQNAYLGGLIFPGPGISAKALAAKTGQLPEIEFTQQPDFSAPATDTVTAIKNGMFFGYAAIINGLCRKLKRTLPETPRVIATGGYAKHLKAACPVLDEIIPDLVLQGLWWTQYNSCLPQKSNGLPAN